MTILRGERGEGERGEGERGERGGEVGEREYRGKRRKM